jgi:integrase
VKNKKLTKREIDALPRGTQREYFVWDCELKGFGLRVSAMDRRTFVVKYRPLGRRKSRRLTIGTYPGLTADEARKLAKLRLAEVAQGRDPARERQTSKLAPTVKELGETYLEDVRLRNKPRTAAEYKRLWEKHVSGVLGSLKVADVASSDLAKLHRQMRETPYLANRVLNMLGAFFSFAIREVARAQHDNPAQLVSRYAEAARERFLTAEEFGRLGEALDQAERVGLPVPPKLQKRSRGMSKTRRAKLTGRKRGPYKRHAPIVLQPANAYAVAAIRLLTLTGCRESEILSLRWDYVDFERGFLRLPDTKTGKSIRPLASSTAAVLHGLPRIMGNSYVLPGDRPGEHLKEIKRLWYAVRHAAKLDDLRLHDLRHSYASIPAIRGESMLVVASLLGHSRIATTEKYAHLGDDPVRAAGERTSETIARLLKAGTKDSPSSPLQLSA